MWAYSMVAVGAINWDYQRHQTHVVRNSLLIIIPGIILLALTFSRSGQKFLRHRIVQALWTLIGIAALIFAFTNK